MDTPTLCRKHEELKSEAALLAGELADLPRRVAVLYNPGCTLTGRSLTC